MAMMIRLGIFSFWPWASLQFVEELDFRLAGVAVGGDFQVAVSNT
ncbi:MAG: hypothetical protein R3D81_03450 [Thalassovita sp.]